MAATRLSILDQSPVSEGMTGAQALHNTVELAQLADRLGYHRYWVSEHHGTPMLAGPAPEALIGPIASATERIRVGSGGVMLPHYSPFKVAESFSLLSGLFPGRIDLGIGRAAGTDPMTTHALQRDRRTGMPDDFPQQLAELLAFLDDRLPPDHPFARLAALPGLPSGPSRGCWAPRPRARSGPGSSGCPTRSPTSSTPRARDRRAVPGEVRGLRAPGRPARGGVRVDHLRGHRRGGRGAGASSRMAMSMMRQGRLIAVPPVEKALRYLESRDRSPELVAAARGARLAGHREGRARAGGRRVPAPRR